MCMADDADKVTLLSESGPRARKEYKCAECSRTIKIGEKYQSDRYLFDGQFSIHRTCLQCMVCREWLQKECSGWLYGGIYEDAMKECSGTTAGYYEVERGSWRKFANPGEKYLCDACMFKDERYITVYGKVPQ